MERDAKMYPNIKKDEFDKVHTSYCKGIAIIFMIVHHLFWNVPNIGIKLGDMTISQRVGIVGKVCVSIFLILSGIGLYKTYNKNIDKKYFYSKHLVKLYFNYMFTVITSVIIIVVLFPSKFNDMIGFNINGFLKLILSLTGYQYIIGYQGINAAWWFMSVILTCYLLFPIILRVINKHPLRILIFSFLLSFINIVKINRLGVLDIISWMFPFVLGCYISHENLFEKIKININLSSNTERKYKKILLILTMLFFTIIRSLVSPQGIAGIKIDYILAVLIILNVYILFENLNISKKVICYLGNKSMDIYYIHMFISNYLFVDLVYGINNTFVMVFVVILFSLIWSYILDFIRLKIKFKNIINRCNELIMTLEF